MKNLFTMAMILVVAATINMYGQQEGNEAPDFKVNLEGGGTFKLSDQLGKVVFVYLFGNSCHGEAAYSAVTVSGR